jgi:hypothetical protein
MSGSMPNKIFEQPVSPIKKSNVNKPTGQEQTEVQKTANSTQTKKNMSAKEQCMQRNYKDILLEELQKRERNKPTEAQLMNMGAMDRFLATQRTNKHTELLKSLELNMLGMPNELCESLYRDLMGLSPSHQSTSSNVKCQLVFLFELYIYRTIFQRKRHRQHEQSQIPNKVNPQNLTGHRTMNDFGDEEITDELLGLPIKTEQIWDPKSKKNKRT